MKNVNTPPIKVGDELEVSVEAVGAKGDGIAKIEGFVVVVPKGESGQTYKVKVTRVFPNMGFCEIV